MRLAAGSLCHTHWSWSGSRPGWSLTTLFSDSLWKDLQRGKPRPQLLHTFSQPLKFMLHISCHLADLEGSFSRQWHESHTIYLSLVWLNFSSSVFAVCFSDTMFVLCTSREQFHYVFSSYLWWHSLSAGILWGAVFHLQGTSLPTLCQGVYRLVFKHCLAAPASETTMSSGKQD